MSKYYRAGPNLSSQNLVSSRRPSISSFAMSRRSQSNLRASYAGTDDSHYAQRNGIRPASTQDSVSDKYDWSPDPTAWGIDNSRPEADDALHDPSRDANKNGAFSLRGFRNIGCLVVLCLGILGLFVGYPIAQHIKNSTKSSSSLAAKGPEADNKKLPLIGNWGLIDPETPKDAYTIPSFNDPSQTDLKLVFSDEFNTEGRSFYPGDDPYWEAVDLHYWQTKNFEWYDPSAITTRSGALEINLTNVPDPSLNHNLDYRGGMVSTWNKFCFTGGLIVANVMLPGATNVFGLWPAVWTMGNLGRAGYGASLDGMWPYVYDACDLGTLANQTFEGGPPAALNSGDDSNNGVLSYLPGQRLSRCTCPGESHPGPIHQSDGSYVGRSAPEIDMFGIGGEVDARVGQVSQSVQYAPFNKGYHWDNSSVNLILADLSLSHQNSFSGNNFQEAASVVSTTNQSCYQHTDQCFSVHGFEYVSGYENAYITWITNNKMTWTLNAAGMGADTETGISARPITDEPLYIIANLGISKSFGDIDYAHLNLPATMLIDYVRVYQHPDKINIGCDPPERPTAKYIETYLRAYQDANLTTWVDDYGQTVPKNKLIDKC
ncbi:GH16 domain-containing protein [Favolaschia claudopus]|uniref:GH16 domain-containing protein n=1 Tax=Favolaschia claudopus TaxID=2862362 RepID=A0AAW0CYU5_9AGAR